MPARFTCSFQDRSFAAVPRPGRAIFSPVRFSHAARWGPQQAEISVRGDEQSLWSLLDWLRYGVTINDSVGNPVWWGFMNEAVVTIGAFSVGLSLDTMANKIAVAYNAILPGATSSGVPSQTTWAQYDESVTTYGIKEAILRLSDAQDDQAVRYRDSALVIGQSPTPTISWASGGKASATIRCVGWHEILKWRYFANAAEGAGYIYVQADGEVYLNTSGAAAYGQTFQLAGQFGCKVTTVQLHGSKIGSPSAGLTCEIWTNGSGAPGTKLGMVTVPAGSVSFVLGWIPFDFSSLNITLASGTTYWLVVYGATDASNAYSIGVSTTQGYGAGQGQQAPTVTWSAAGWDMFFQVAGIRDTTDVMIDIATAYGQGVFTAVVPTSASGVSGTAYSDGSSRALDMLEQQLDAGTTTALRMLARVEPDRSISIYPEPGAPPSFNPDYLIDTKGRFYTYYKVPIDPWRCPVGGWARIVDLASAATDISSLATGKHFFIEEIEYDVASNRLTPTPRGQTSVFNLTGVA